MIKLSKEEINQLAWGNSTDKYLLIEYNKWVGDGSGFGICEFIFTYNKQNYKCSILYKNYYEGLGEIDYDSLKIKEV